MSVISEEKGDSEFEVLADGVMSVFVKLPSNWVYICAYYEKGEAERDEQMRYKATLKLEEDHPLTYGATTMKLFIFASCTCYNEATEPMGEWNRADVVVFMVSQKYRLVRGAVVYERYHSIGY